jgi:hypothetical protein
MGRWRRNPWRVGRCHEVNGINLDLSVSEAGRAYNRKIREENPKGAKETSFRIDR